MPPIDPEHVAASLHKLHLDLEDDELLPLLENVLDACNELFGLSGCGLLIEDAEQGLAFVAATNAVSESLERAQVELAEGPCVDAFIHGGIVETDDLPSDHRWPLLNGIAHDLGARAVLGCAVAVEGIPVGSLDVYLDSPRAWDESERRALTRYGEVVGSILASAITAQRASDIADQLRTALESRVIIERAVGFIMATMELPAAGAFEALRGAARRERRKVRELAQEVLDGRAVEAP